jgi:hypothetical protein
MATQIKTGLFVTVAGMVLVVTVAALYAEGAKDEFRFDAAKLKDRATWIQVNTEPYYISSQVNVLCAPAHARIVPESRRNPHDGSYIFVYVNKLGREAMFAKESQQFPEGSLIVKEKISTTSKDRKPVLYTIMRKREAGYNPKVGDWEFSVVGPDGRQLQAIGKLENCQTCHIGKSESDFVFRPYLKSE